MGRERVAQSMARGALGDAGSTYGVLHSSLDGGRVNVMAPPLGAGLMGVGPRRRKHPLSRPLGGRTGRLSLERVRQHGTDLVPREHDREAMALLGMDDTVRRDGERPT